MKYFVIDPETGSKVVDDYVHQFATTKTRFPDDMSTGEKMIAWLLIVNLHAIAETIDEADEEWKN